MPMRLEDLRRNLALKIFSFLIAVVWWAVVRGADTRVRDFNVPVDYANLSESMELSGRVVDTLMVRLRASDDVLRNLSEDRLSAAIDLSRAPMGEQRVPIGRGMLRVPAGLEVVRIVPAVVSVRIERRVRRQVPIVVEFAGRPPDGFEKTGHSVAPPTATVEGPSSEVAQVTRALAGTILLEGEKADLEFVTHPTPEAPAGSHVRVVSPTEPVMVRVAIGVARPALPPPAPPPAPRGATRPAPARRTGTP
jgi:YbbR domain-containing protein